MGLEWLEGAVGLGVGFEGRNKSCCGGQSYSGAPGSRSRSV